MAVPPPPPQSVEQTAEQQQHSQDDERTHSWPTPIAVPAVRVASPHSPPALLRPQAQHARPLLMREDSLGSINSSLSFLIREAAQIEDDRRRARSRQSATHHAATRQAHHHMQPLTPASAQNNQSLDMPEHVAEQIGRAKSPWFAVDAIRVAAEEIEQQQQAQQAYLQMPLPPDRRLAQSTPPRLSHDAPHRTFTPTLRPSSPLRRAHTPLFRSSRSRTTTPMSLLPDHQAADLVAQMRLMTAQKDGEEDTLLLQRIRKASSAATPGGGMSRLPTPAPATQQHDDEGGALDEHVILKGDEHDEDVVSKTRSRSSSVLTTSDGNSNTSRWSHPVAPMSDDEKLQAIIDEFGPAEDMPPGTTEALGGAERVLGSQGAVLVRRVLVRGYMVLTTHRICFVALLGSHPTRHKILQQGPAVIHRPGLTRRKRRCWMALTSESIIAYRSSAELYEPLGGLRLVDIDDVQPSPQERSVHFRVRGKRLSIEFETAEAALTWQREIDAALFMMTHNVDKIRLCLPLVRVANVFFNDVLDMSTMIHFDVLDAESQQQQQHTQHKHATARLLRSHRSDPRSTTDVIFAVLHGSDQLVKHIRPALVKPTEIRSRLDHNEWHTLPAALIDVDGPRADSPKVSAEGKAAQPPTAKAHVFIEQFSLDCELDEVMTFKVHLLRTFPLAGTLAVTPKHVCFYRHHRWTGLADTRIRIPLRDVQSAEANRAFLWHHHGLRVHVRAHEGLAFEFKDEALRDRVIELLTAGAKQAQDDRHQRKPAPQDGNNSDSHAKRPHKHHSSSSTADAAVTSTDLLAMQERPDKVVVSPAHINMMPRMVNVTSLNHRITVSPMKIHCLTIGSRGDVQPYVALCKRLQKDGHTCTIVSHDEYRTWVESNGIAFRAVGGDPGELMKLSVENNKMLFSPQFYREAMGKFRHWLDELLRGIMETCWDADLLIESPSTFGGIHVAEAVGCYYMRAFTMPWTKTSAYPQAFSVPNVDLGPQYNAMSYTLFDQILWLASSGQINRWRKHMLHLAATDLSKLDQGSVPFMYNFSPAVVPPPLDWGDLVKVTGYWNLHNDATKWDAPQELLQFIRQAKQDGKKLCYIGFGSITMQDPLGVQRNIYEAVQQSDVRAIVSKGWSSRMLTATNDGEAVSPPTPPAEVYVVDSIPHDWLFPRIDMAMHHGGAGTTGASLRAGLVTLIHPFFGDQYFWSGRVSKMGAGVRVKSLQADDIAEALQRGRDEQLMTEKAQQIGEAIRKERGVDVAVDFIYHSLHRSKRVKRTTMTTTSTSTTSTAVAAGRDMGEEKVKAAANHNEDDRRFSLSSLWSTDSFKVPVDRLLARSHSTKTNTAEVGGKSRTEGPQRRQEESHATSMPTTDEPEEMKQTAAAEGDESEQQTMLENALQQADTHPAAAATPDEPTPPTRSKSWYSHPLHYISPATMMNSMPTLSMPHVNFLHVLPHRSHTEAAAMAKERMTEEEKEHAQNEDKARHLSARQEDQRRRQLLELTWRKAKRFDLLGHDVALNVQPEEEEDDYDEDVEDADEDDVNADDGFAADDQTARASGESATTANTLLHHVK